MAALVPLLSSFLALGARAQSPESLRASAERSFAAAAAAPVAAAQQGAAPPPAGPGLAPAPRPADGPEAALELERGYRGKKNPDYKPCEHGDKPHAPVRRKREEEAYPDAKPVPFAGLRNIAPMSPELWRAADLEKDFAKNKGEGQEAILIIVKTELCRLNEHRVCAAATAVLEKRATPALAKFKIYGAWIKANPANDTAALRRWEEDVAETYQFRQGPGANLIVLVPGVGRPFMSSAQELGLTVDELETNKGQAPKLERFLNEALEAGRRLRR
ncbi:MAG TPA: hypothetical protein VNI01_05570 [Elusimicrobiota bacterium]|nr:hypothetical protein [Elusimicrobiota bacterium]